MPDFGDGSQREDWGAMDTAAPSVANGQITPEQWAEYQRKRRRDAIMGIIATLGGATALGGLGAAMSGGGAAAASAAPGVQMAVDGTALGTGVATGGGAQVPAALAGAATTGAKIGTGTGVAGSTLGLSPTDWAALALSGASTVGGALSNNNAPTAPSSATTDPNMQQLIKMMQGRLTKSEPLYDSILSMANGLLPMQYQQKGGGGMP